jgi:hypothetical protein
MVQSHDNTDDRSLLLHRAWRSTTGDVRRAVGASKFSPPFHFENVERSVENETPWRLCRICYGSPFSSWLLGLAACELQNEVTRWQHFSEMTEGVWHASTEDAEIATEREAPSRRR